MSLAKSGSSSMRRIGPPRPSREGKGCSVGEGVILSGLSAGPGRSWNFRLAEHLHGRNQERIRVPIRASLERAQAGPAARAARAKL